MKKIYLLISMIALLLVSCDRKAEFQHESFATLNAVKYTVREDAGEFKIPVSLYNPTGRESQFIITTTDYTAVKDVDYEIVSPASGVLTFASDETTKDIVIKLNHNTAFQKSKTFDLTIASADDSYSIGNLSTAKCTIKDAEHPLDMFIGEWKGTAISIYDGTTYPLTVNISEDESDETYSKLRIDGLEPTSSALTSLSALRGTVNSDKTRITIASGQQIGYMAEYSTYFNLSAFTIAGENLNIVESLTMTLSADGKLTVDNVYGCLFTYADGNEYVWDAYAVEQLTRK